MQKVRFNDMPRAVQSTLVAVSTMFDDRTEALRVLVRNTRKADSGAWIVGRDLLRGFYDTQYDMWMRRNAFNGSHPVSVLTAMLDPGGYARPGVVKSARKPTLGFYDRKRDVGHENASIYNPKERK